MNTEVNHVFASTAAVFQEIWIYFLHESSQSPIQVFSRYLRYAVLNLIYIYSLLAFVSVVLVSASAFFLHCISLLTVTWPCARQFMILLEVQRLSKNKRLHSFCFLLYRPIWLTTRQKVFCAISLACSVLTSCYIRDSLRCNSEFAAWAKPLWHWCSRRAIFWRWTLDDMCKTVGGIGNKLNFGLIW